MISLKRNNKLELVPAVGMRTRQSSIYTPGQSEEFKISRSKFNDFLTCPRCFYLDRVKGLASPGMPGWTLNETTDLLLKKEFDICRKNQIPHEIFKKNNLNYFLSFRGGLQLGKAFSVLQKILLPKDQGYLTSLQPLNVHALPFHGQFHEKILQFQLGQ